MPGSIDDIDAVISPETGGGSAGNGNPPLLLLFHPVHNRSAFVDLAHLVGNPGVIEYPLGGGRLPGVNVGHDADIANHF